MLRHIKQDLLLISVNFKVLAKDFIWRVSRVILHQPNDTVYERQEKIIFFLFLLQVKWKNDDRENMNTMELLDHLPRPILS